MRGRKFIHSTQAHCIHKLYYSSILHRRPTTPNDRGPWTVQHTASVTPHHTARMGKKGREQHTLRVVIILGLRNNWTFYKFMQILCSSPVRVNWGLTEENTLMCIISLIWCFKSLIGDILSIWGLVICSVTLRYETHISPIPSWINIIPNWGSQIPNLEGSRYRSE